MQFWEGVRLAMVQIRTEKLKSFFSLLGVIIGVMFLIIVVSVVEGMDRYIRDNVASYIPLDEYGPETYRRSIYHQNARASRIDLMTDFDAPDCAMTAPRRVSTTTPLQALTLMNHSFTLDMAEAMAARVESEAGARLRAQAVRAYELALLRPPNPAELKESIALIEGFGLRALCRALFNSNEFVYLN